MGRRSRLEKDPLATWLDDGYESAYRTAFLILHNRADAEEAVQEAFLRAWRFRAAVPTDAGVKPWMYRVVVNACLSKARSERRHQQRAVAGSADRPDPEPLPDALTLATESQRVVLEAIARLPDQLRTVVALRYYAQLSEKEIAAAIHRRPGTVKSRLHHARTLLAADHGLRSLFDRDLVEDGADA